MITRIALLVAVAIVPHSWAQITDDLESADRALKSGDYAGAVRIASDAAKRYEANGERSKLGKALNTIGAASVHKGDYAAGLLWFERSLQLARETGDIVSEVRRRNNIGGLHIFDANYIEAFAQYQAALARLAGSESQPWFTPMRQFTLTNLAVLHQQLGQHQRALELYQEIRRLPLQLEPSLEAQMLINLAVVYRRLGDPYKALENYKRARVLLAHDPNAAATLYALHNAAVVMALDFGDYRGALQTFAEALRLAEKTGSRREAVLERLFLGQTRLLMNQPGEAAKEFDAALNGAVTLKLVDERWTALYGLGRAQSAVGDAGGARRRFDEAIAVIESARSRLGATSLKEEFLADKRDVYDAVIGVLVEQPNPPLAEILRHIEEGRSRNLKELLAVEEQAVDLPAIQRSLGERDMLLEYWMAGGRLAVIWIARDSQGMVQRSYTKRDASRLEALIRSLGDPHSDDWNRLSQEVYGLLLNGVPLDSARVERLIVVPDGSLFEIPFEVLGPGRGARLIERFPVSYLPSAHFLRARRGRGANAKWPWETVASIFADPVASVEGTSPFNAAPLPPLVYSAEEGRAVARALPGSESLFIGADNLKRYVFTPATAGSRVIHFATHAAVDLTDSRRSRMIFSAEPGNPRSAFLFENEIAKLKLSAVELVTLAACESERGRDVRGEGVQNFSRAFLGASAASTVSSLWKVSDRATARLMAGFYSRLAGGAPKDDALRRAKLEFISAGGSLAHPYYWAAFLLTGDGASPLSPVIRWWQIASAGLGLLALLGIVRRRRQSRK